jgi:drug/metabolite transporter (DMT)-like permease
VTSNVAVAPKAETTAASNQLALALMIGFAASWALVEGLFRSRLRLSYDLTEVVWWRYGTHLIIVFALWGWRHPARIWRTSRPMFQISRSLLMLIMPVSFALAIKGGMPVSTAVSMMWLAPAMILLTPRVLLGEPLNFAAALAVLTAFFAVLLILEPVAVLPLRATAWAILMGGSFALYVVMTRSLRHELLGTNLFYTAAGVFVGLSLYVPRVWVAPGAHDMVVLVSLGAMGFVALLALDRAVEGADLSTTVPFLYLQIVFAQFLERQYQRHLPPPHVLSGLLIIVGVALISWRRTTRSTKVTAPVPQT